MNEEHEMAKIEPEEAPRAFEPDSKAIDDLFELENAMRVEFQNGYDQGVRDIQQLLLDETKSFIDEDISSERNAEHLALLWKTILKAVAFNREEEDNEQDF